MMMKHLMILLMLFLLPAVSLAEETPQRNDHQGSAQEEPAKEEEPPKVDSVWGAMRYTGYNIKKGSVAAGHGIKEGSIKAGKTMEKGFKKAGHSIKTFFVGDDDK